MCPPRQWRGRRRVDQQMSVADVTKPTHWILLQATAAHTADGRGQLVIVRLHLQNRRCRCGDTRPGKEPSASDHLEEDYAKGPDVRARVDGLAARLLRRHVDRKSTRLNSSHSQ